MALSAIDMLWRLIEHDQYPSMPALKADAPWHRDARMHGFANNLEGARRVRRRYRHLVECEPFPEPYRTVIMERDGYDPETETWVDLDDAHLIDPVAADAADEEFAREALETHAQQRARTRAEPTVQ